MNRGRALELIFGAISMNDAVVSTTGLISREIYERFDSERNIYVPGSMGLVSSIGLALAMCAPDRRVVVVDGDASLLMNLGTLVTIGNSKPKNLLHLMLDNNAYASCNEEQSMSSSADLTGIARIAGYKFAVTIRGERELAFLIENFDGGPGLIRVMIELGGRRDFKRPNDSAQIKDRFMKFIKNKRRIL